MCCVLLVASVFISPIIVFCLHCGSRRDFSPRFVCGRVGKRIDFLCSMGCSCFPRVPGKNYITQEKRYLASALLEEISEAGSQQPHSTADYWCGTLLVWVLVSHSVFGQHRALGRRSAVWGQMFSEPAKEKIRKCHLQNVAMKGLEFVFFFPTFCLLSNLTWIHSFGCGSSKGSAPFWKGSVLHQFICLLLTYRAVQKQEALAPFRSRGNNFPLSCAFLI